MSVRPSAQTTMRRGHWNSPALAPAPEVLHMPAFRVHDDHARSGLGPRGIQNVEVARAVEADVLDRGELLPLGAGYGGPDAVHRFEIHGKPQIFSRQIDHLLGLDTSGPSVARKPTAGHIPWTACDRDCQRILIPPLVDHDSVVPFSPISCHESADSCPRHRSSGHQVQMPTTENPVLTCRRDTGQGANPVSIGGPASYGSCRGGR